MADTIETQPDSSLPPAAAGEPTPLVVAAISVESSVSPCLRGEKPLTYVDVLGPRLLSALTHREVALFTATLFLYMLTRFVGLERFPIYFFCDEAIHPAHAYELLQHGGYDGYDTFLPPYFRNSDKFNLGLSVYIHLVSVALFGKSVFVTRATSALVSLLAPVAVALTLKLVFRSRFWWTGPLVLTAIPSWFLHTRTAFEVVMMVSFYACFLCSYLLYRYCSPRYLAAAIIFGAATFYSYANGQGVMLISILLLLLSDLGYHLGQWRAIAAGLPLLGLVAAPYLRFRWLYPEGLAEHLRVVGSIWVKDVPLSEKLLTFATNYLGGLSPLYWFAPNQIDLERHRMKDMGHIALYLLPFVLLGLLVCLRHWRSSAHRALLIAVLAAPFSAALAQVAITRAMAIFVPMTLLACLGLDQLAAILDRAQRYKRSNDQMLKIEANSGSDAQTLRRFDWLAVSSAAVLSVTSLSMLYSALSVGPTWYSDYTLYGMQYGASQIYRQIEADLRAAPETRFVVTPNWANNSDVFRQFFLDDAQAERVKIDSVDSFMTYKAKLPPQTTFVLLEQEYRQARVSGKFVVGKPTQIIRFPDGRPGFYFVPMRYVDNIDAILAAEKAARSQLIEETAVVDGQIVQVRHSLLDIGTAAMLFDGNFYELIRGFEANPLIIEVTFPEPRTLAGFDLTTGALDYTLDLSVTAPDGTTRSATTTYRGLPPDPRVQVELPGGAQPVRTLRLALSALNAAADVPTHIHVRDLKLR